MAEIQLDLPADPYPEIIYQSFLENSVRSALLIDDQFPMFDTPDEELHNYNQRDRAKNLYRTFKNRKIICDIESSPAVLEDKAGTDRLQKSDLIVLDYHLTKGEESSEKALAILRNLAGSKHFNVVALYTASDDLETVWIEVAATLRGGWQEPENIILDAEQLQKYRDLEDDGKLPDSHQELLICCLENGMSAAMKEPAKKLRAAFEAAGVEQKMCTDFIKARISQDVKDDRLVGVAYDEKSNVLSGHCKDPYWIQSGNLFIAIMKKGDPVEGEGENNDPERIWERLTASIKAWRPNLLQIMLSEIQNTLEIEGVTIDPHYAGSNDLQTGILFNLFSNLPLEKNGGQNQHIQPAIEDLTWKLVESIRRKISTNPRLLNVAYRLITYEMSKEQWEKTGVDPKKREKEVLKFVKKHLMTSKSVNDDDLIFELNCFLSAEVFRGSHLTTGSIFKSDGEDEWYLCCSPACDMEPRPPRKRDWKRQPWQLENYPAQKMIALRLEKTESPTADLKSAHLGKNIFIKDCNENKFQFAVLDSHNHPSWEIFILEKSGKVNSSGGSLPNAKFESLFIRNKVSEQDAEGGKSMACNFEKGTFSVVAQLRPEYANRILQFTGNHLSRIGVDYLSLP
ncbi:MAG: response regulator receiver domain [Pseudomonadota bacterium]